MVRIRYSTIRHREYYVAILKERFGGKSVPVNQEVADFCASESWCPWGGAKLLLRNDRALSAWSRSDDKLCRQEWTLQLRWRNLARFVNARHARLKRARAKAR